MKFVSVNVVGRSLLCLNSRSLSSFLIDGDTAFASKCTCRLDQVCREKHIASYP